MKNPKNTTDIFYNRIPNTRIFFTLILDIKNRKEEILLGSKSALNCNFRNLADAEPPFDEKALIDALGEPAEVKLLYSTTRPLGSFFNDLLAECRQDWAEFIYMPLHHLLSDISDYCEYGLKFDWTSEKFNLEESDVTEDKILMMDEFYNNFKNIKTIKQFCLNHGEKNPIRKYISYRIWNDFCKCQKEMLEYDEMKKNADALTRALSFNRCQPDCREKNINEISFWVPEQLAPSETSLEIWYPNRHRNFECAMIEHSLFPLISYYINHLYHAGFHLRKCKVCNKIFVADTLKKTLCGSKDCKRIQGARNKQRFDSKEKPYYEKSYNQVRRNFKDRINTLAKKTTISESELNLLEAVFQDFKEKAKKESKYLDTTKKMLDILRSNNPNKMESIDSIKISLTQKQELKKCILNPSALKKYIENTQQDLETHIQAFKILTSDSPESISSESDSSKFDSYVGKMIKTLEEKYK